MSKNIMNEAFYVLLEQVHESVEKLNNNLSKSGNNETFDYSKLEELNSKLERIEKKVDDSLYTDDTNSEFNHDGLNERLNELMQSVKEPRTVNNRYTIDFKSSRTFIVILFLSLVILLSTFLHYKQYDNNKKLKANDLKYRYIKMQGGIRGNDIDRLENFFYYPDSSYMIMNIKKYVLDHEHRVEQQIRMQEQIKRNEERNQKLKNEMDKLK